MKICVIGVGYVGLVVGACLSEMGNDVICVDNNEQKLALLKQGITPIYEPLLDDLIKTNIKEGRLTFSNNAKEAIKKSLVCFIAVQTPQGEDGSADLKYVEEVAKTIGQSIKNYTVVVNKSTVPVGSAEKIENIIKQETNVDFDIVSNPEFLKQGDAVNDFLKPDRVIIGAKSPCAFEIMQELYMPFLRTGNPIIKMDLKSAELTKYAANSFLALKISYANEIANICEKVGADVDLIRMGMSSDKRIGSHFLFSGIGFGGSCFPKDIKALIKTAKDNGCDYSLLDATNDINENQRHIFINKILKKFGQDLTGKTIAIWGLAFKPQTNDLRQAPSITVINALLDHGAKIKAFDPRAIESAKFYFKDKIEYAKSAYEALENADCMALLTEWNEFRRPDFAKIKGLMKSPIIFDGRNQYNTKTLQELGFEYYRVGK